MASFSSSLMRRVDRDVLLELLVGDVRQHLLAVRAHDGLGGRGRLLGRGLLDRGGRCLLGRRLARGLLGRAGGRGLARGACRSRAGGGGRTDVHGDALGAQMGQEGLEVAWLDGGRVAGLPDLVRSHRSARRPGVDEGDDCGVRQHLGGEQLACVRRHEHLSSLKKGRGKARLRQGRESHSATALVNLVPSPGLGPGERRADRTASGLGGLRGGLGRLLVLAHLQQAVGVDHVGDRAVARPGRSRRRRPPSPRAGRPSAWRAAPRRSAPSACRSPAAPSPA